jgi:hypothetical protein
MFLLELRVLLDTIRRQGKRGMDLEFVGLFLGVIPFFDPYSHFLRAVRSICPAAKRCVDDHAPVGGVGPALLAAGLFPYRSGNGITAFCRY